MSGRNRVNYVPRYSRNPNRRLPVYGKYINDQYGNGVWNYNPPRHYGSYYQRHASRRPPARSLRGGGRGRYEPFKPNVHDLKNAEENRRFLSNRTGPLERRSGRYSQDDTLDRKECLPLKKRQFSTGDLDWKSGKR